MKTNQQELNLKFMSRKKENSGGTTIKYLNFLNRVQTDLKEYDIANLYVLTYKYKVTNRWTTWLKENNVVYVNELGLYKWNDKIPVSIKLIDSFRKYNSRYNIKHTPSAFTEEFKNKMDSEKVIKAKPKNRIEVKYSDILEKPVSKNYKNTNTQEIGLIRKFLKWIY